MSLQSGSLQTPATDPLGSPNAVLDGKVITAEEVKNLAELPSKEQLLSSIMGGLDSGARGIAGCFEGIIRDIALLVEEVAKKNNAA